MKATISPSITQLKVLFAIESAKNPWHIDKEQCNEYIAQIKDLEKSGDLILDKDMKFFISEIEIKLASIQGSRRPCFV